MEDAILGLAQGADVAAYGTLVRPHVDRLRRLARIVTGDGRAADAAVVVALTRTRRDLRAVRATADLGPTLERALAAALSRRGIAAPSRQASGDAARLAEALGPLRPADRIAVARCLDPEPDARALEVAARLGVDHPDTAPGRSDAKSSSIQAGDGAVAFHGRVGSTPTIIDLDGPLAEWDLPRLRAALAAWETNVERDGPGARAGTTLEDDELAARYSRGGTRQRGLGPAGERRHPPPGSRPSSALTDSSDELVVRALAGRAGRLAPAWLAHVRHQRASLRPVLGAAAAGALSIAVVVAAMAAPPADRTRAGVSAPASLAAEASVAPTARGPLGLAGNDRVDDVHFPATVGGFTVGTIAGAMAVAQAPAEAAVPIAVSGWLTAPQLSGGCPTPAMRPAPASGPPAPSVSSGSAAPSPDVVTDPLAADASFCLRVAVLRDSAGDGSQFGGGHLHVQFLPGTALTGLDPTLVAGGTMLPAVLLGHFGDPRAFPCDPGGHDCGLGFVVDRVLWAAGTTLPQPIAIGSPASAGRHLDAPVAGRIAAGSVGGSARVVSVAGVAPSDVAAAEPAAASAMSGRAYAWLVRIAFGDGDRVAFGTPAVLPSITWVLVDDGTGRIIDQGSPGRG